MANKLQLDKSLLILIDMQEKFRPAIHEMDRVVDKSVRLLQAAKMMRVPYLVSEQYPEGLGHTVPELLAMMRETDIFSKTSFSCYGDEAMKEAIEGTGRKQIVLAGIETHVCLQQTANDLVRAGYEVFLIEDAASSRYPFDHVTAVDRMRVNDVVITSLEMTLFEWLGDAKNPAFKAVSGLIK